MKMLINHLILHILDFVSGVCVFSQTEQMLDNSIVNDFIMKHLDHAKTNYKGSTGILMKNSVIVHMLEDYTRLPENFVDFSQRISDLIYKQLLDSDKQLSMDVVIVDFSMDKEDYFAILMMESKTAFTHQVINDSGVIKNLIIQHHSILPSVTQKIDSYAIINMNTKEVILSDKRRYINGKDVFILKDKVLQCSSVISSKDVIKAVSGIVTKIAETHGHNSAVALSRTKNYIRENAEVSDLLLPREIGKEVFFDSDELQRSYNDLVEESHLPKTIKLEKKIAFRTGKNHKIKTDTGIEIIIPTEYFDNHQFVEFVNNPDGTISIELKNIGKIINKS